MQKEPTIDELMEFIEKLDKCEINPMDYIMGEAHNECLVELAERGICVEELIKLDRDEVIENLIAYGHAREHYEEWRHHPNKDIRYQLAEQGYFPETYINDTDTTVKSAAIWANPQLIPQIIDDPLYTHDAVLSLYDLYDLDVELCQKVYDKCLENKLQSIKGLKLKLDAMKHKPNSFETTMTRQQLYQIGSPLWAREYTMRQLDSLYKGQKIVEGEKLIKQIETVLIVSPKDPDWQEKVNALILANIVTI